MLSDTNAIEKAVHAKLENDPTLSAYVKSFTRGDMNVSRKSFPFVNVAVSSIREKQLMAASGVFEYSFDVYAGTKNLAPGVAYKGSETTGTKGIADLCHDIANCIENNCFSNTFQKPPDSIRIFSRYRMDNAETLFVGKVSFKSEFRFMHRT